MRDAKVVAGLLGLSMAMALPQLAAAHRDTTPIRTCDAAGIGSVRLRADGPPVTITEVSTGTAGTGAAAVPYCLVKVLVPTAINIWVGLPMDGRWNGRLQSLGGGGYAGSVSVPTAALLGGYVGITTDTGHVGSDGSFGMLAPGVPNTPLQIDFAFRSEHLMAVIGKQLTEAFYGRRPAFSYWNGCSTGGRQGLMMAQRFPRDYDGILAGAPAIHWDRFQAAQIWPQMVMFRDTGANIAPAKLDMATAAAVSACDAEDGIADGVIDDPRGCDFDARELVCAPGDDPAGCLTAAEAGAVDKIWEGPTTRHRQRRLWFGLEPGTSLLGLAGPSPFFIAVNQPRFWVYLDPTWDWHVLDYRNYESFFADTVREVGPIMATDDPDLSRFRDRGSKILLWHGWADPLIMPQGTVRYYERVVRELRGLRRTQEFARLFMAPGVGHCGGGAGPQPQGLFAAVVDWVEHGRAPERILATRALAGGATRSRPLCPYPAVARWTGSGSTDDAANFACAAPRR
jgi:hypothetical protein